MKFNEDKGKLVFSFSFASFLASLILLRLSGFSSSTIVNLENYVIKSIMLSSSDTFTALYTFLRPFFLVFLALIFLVLAVSILSYYGCRRDDTMGRNVGIISMIFTLVLFPAVAGIFLAVAVFFCSFYSTKLSSAYSKELKKWVAFRIGSNTVGKVLFIFNILIVIGVFLSVLASQNVYATSFRQDITETMRSVAVALPGASAIPSEVLNERIETAVQTSPIFASYITWLPVTSALTTWIVLEFLRNVVLANIGGLFTYLMLRRSKW